MNDILVALAIGIVAGIIDIVPMIIQKLDKYSCISAFCHWVILGLVIPFVDWNIASWLKGLLLGEMLAIPLMIIVSKNDKRSLLPMALFSALLGIGVAVASSKIIH